MKDLILLIRPHQWLKNLFVFLPLFFDRQLTDINSLISCIWVGISYSLAASAIYCFNDIWDVEADKMHPKKCKRPIASGKITKSSGYVLMITLILLSFATLFLGFYNNQERLMKVCGIIALYFIMNLAYCIKLKQKALIDTFIIAIGFVLRVLIGGFATGIWISHWIILMTFLLALFLAFAKRRDDVVMYEGLGIKARQNVNKYNSQFMNQAISIIASITIVCYVMYTVSPEVIERMGSSYLYVTSIWVLLGIMRFLQITIVDVKSGSPTKVLLHDCFIQTTIVGWLLTFIVIIYF